MYGKIFTSIYDGTLAEDWRALITFQQFIVLCDADGIVDMTPQSISRRTGIPIEHIKAGIEILEKSDKFSRTPDEDGKRIELIDEHRPWGWHIVNHELYKKLQDADTVRAQTRERVRKHREKKKAGNDKVTTVTDGNVQKRHIDIDTHIDINTNIKPIVELPHDIPSNMIIDYLNKISGKKFKSVEAHKKLIAARIKEGASLDDIKNVIDYKCKEWSEDPKMAKYIRPATLFNAEKFNQYVGELGVETPEDKNKRKIDAWLNEGEVYEH